MKVLKFGGTSVGSASRIKEVAKLITDGEQKIVVLSAMSGTTNTLVDPRTGRPRLCAGFHAGK